MIQKNKKAPARYKANADYILTTKLYCGKCMSFMVGESGISRNATTYRYYKCITAKRKKGCDKKAVKKIPPVIRSAVEVERCIGSVTGG